MNWKEIKNAIYRLSGLSLERTNPYLITDTSAHSFAGQGAFALQALEDCTFTEISTNIEGGNLATKTITAGSIIYVRISSVTLASGSCIIYRVNSSS